MRRALGGQNVVDGLERLRRLAETRGFIPLIGVWPHFADDVVMDPHPMEDGSGDGSYAAPCVQRACLLGHEGSCRHKRAEVHFVGRG